MQLAAEFGTGQVFWSILWFFLFFVWIMLIFTIFGDIIRSDDMGGVAKAIWSIFIIFLPFLGIFMYLIIRGNKIPDHFAVLIRFPEFKISCSLKKFADSFWISLAGKLDKNSAFGSKLGNIRLNNAKPVYPCSQYIKCICNCCRDLGIKYSQNIFI